MGPAAWSRSVAGLAALVLVAAAPRGTAVEIVTSEPGVTTLRDGTRDMQLVNCKRAQPHKPCTLGVGAPGRPPGWVDIAGAEIRQVDAATVEFSMTLQSPIPKSPSVPVLIYYWQFQDGCTEPSPTDKAGVNAFWDGRQWTAQWFTLQNCDARRVVAGEPVPVRFAGRTVTIRARLADLVTRGHATLRWFAATRLLVFDHPVFSRTLPVDTVPDVAVLDRSHPDQPRHPEPLARWISR